MYAELSSPVWIPHTQTGDEREGDEKGDDEKIHVQLARVHPAAAYLCICINSYTGQELDDVKDAQCRLHVSHGP